MGLDAVLTEHGLVTPEQLAEAHSEAAASGERLDRVVARLGFATGEQILEALGDQFHLSIVDLASIAPDAEALGAVPARLAYRLHCVPIDRNDGALTVATSNPFDLSAIDELSLVAGRPVRPVLADDDELRRFIREHYGVGGDTLDEMAGDRPNVASTESDDAAEQANEASVVRLVNDLLGEAIDERATDIHIEPYEGLLDVRYRVDGVLRRAAVPPTIHRFSSAIVSRLKIMANLNVAERRRPQDGRITFKRRTPGRPAKAYDLRVSVIPMLFGEGVVLRVLSKDAVLLSLEDLGMSDGLRARWDTLIARPHGILLVTGPTGSGKSTTLYASLNRIVSEEVKAITVEDPVEYHVKGVNQIQVNHRVGLDFAAGLRSVLRHDPDVVMIGEIRDLETAITAVQASLTGHLVFSTLHTNDAPSATTRLLDMGVEPFLVASSVEGVLAQRLVRRVCASCAQAYAPDRGDLPPGFELPADGTLTRGAGCRECRDSGFRGRVGVYEMLTLSDETREMIMTRANARSIAARAAQDDQLIRLQDDGFAKVRDGKTTLGEIAKAMTT
ncbi:MAG: GspE/PulE family protein [Planctomycetota bacterium]